MFRESSAKSIYNRCPAVSDWTTGPVQPVGSSPTLVADIVVLPVLPSGVDAVKPASRSGYGRCWRSLSSVS